MSNIWKIIYESHRHRNAILNYVSGYNNLSREYGSQKRRWGQDKVMRKYKYETNSHWRKEENQEILSEKPVGSSGPLYKFKASVLLLISADDPLEVTGHVLIMNTVPLCLLFCLMFNYNHVHSYNISRVRIIYLREILVSEEIGM